MDSRPNSLEKRIVMERLAGKTLQQLRVELDMSHESVRQRWLELFVPSWDGDHLTVTYAIHRAQRTEVWQHHSAGSCGKYRMPGPDGGPPVKTPCQPRPASASVLRRGYAADVALVLTYDRRGVLVRERRFAPRAAPGPAPKLESAG